MPTTVTEAIARRVAEAEIREQRWRAQCRDLALRHVKRASDLLERYAAKPDADPGDLAEARRELEIAWRTASQPVGGGLVGGLR